MLHLVAKKLSKTFAITKSLFTFTSTKGIDPLQIADKMENSIKYYVMAYNYELCQMTRVSPILNSIDEAIEFSKRYSVKTAIKQY